MKRIIRIDYSFSHNDRKAHTAFGVNIGETIEPKPQTMNTIKSSAVCHAFDIDATEFIARYGEPWGWTRRDWERKGFHFAIAQETNE